MSTTHPGKPVNPAFVIGVTGNMDPHGYDHADTAHSAAPVAAIRRKVFGILDWARSTGGFLDPRTGEFFPNDRPDANSGSRYNTCWRGLGLGNTPIVVLSSLAPGIDTIVAEAAMDYAVAHGVDVTVRAPLPFPQAIYPGATSFTGDPALTAQKQARLAGVVARIRCQCGFVEERDLFPVPLDPARDGDPGADLADKPRRNLRYRAAGEYIAAFSDLLLAFYDVDFDKADAGNPLDPGAATIVEVKRRGMSDLLIRVQGTFAWADNGPVLIAPIDRTKKLREHPGAACDPRMRFAHPYDCLPPECRDGHCPPGHPRWQEAGDRILRSISRDLARLNLQHPQGEEGELLKMLGKNAGAKTIVESCTTFDFDALARLRRRLANLNARYDGRVKRHMAAFILLAVLSALCLLLFEHWVYRDPPVPAANVALYLAGVACVFLGMVKWLAFFRIGRLDDRQLDTRSLAEAFRVQIYWLIVGTRESVASSYLSRQRGELTWMRSAISSVFFPYGRAQAWFRGLVVEKRREVFEAVRVGWLHGQAVYYAGKVAEFTARKHSLHNLARMLLWAGLFMSITGLIAHAMHHAEAVAHLAPFILGGGLAIMLGLASLREAEKWWEKRHPLHGTHHHPAGNHFWQVFFTDLFHRRILPTAESRQLAGEIIGHAVGLAAGLGLAGVLVGLMFLPALHFDFLPEPVRLLNIGKNLALGGGGLVHLWVAIHFLGENIRRYDAMATLFKGADTRLACHLAVLETHIASRHTAGQDEAIAHAQELLTALGREALAENAEWLLMHRDRRIGPVIGGG